MTSLVVISGASDGTVAFGWVIAGCVSVAAGFVGACLGGGAVLAVDHLRRAPGPAIARTFFSLTALSALLLVPYGVDAYRAYRFVSRAGTSQGVVRQAETRSGIHRWVEYAAGDTTRSLAIRPAGDLRPGDTVRVYYDPDVSSQVFIGLPGPDWSSSLDILVPLWIVGGVLLLGFGVNAAPPGVPKNWLRHVRLLRAYLGAALMADFGFVLVMLAPTVNDDPRGTLVGQFWDLLFFGGLVSLVLTLLLGTLAFRFLQRRAWTSDFAYALTGIGFGSVFGLVDSSVLLGGVSGLFAGVTFRALYFWGGDPSDNPSDKDATATANGQA